MPDISIIDRLEARITPQPGMIFLLPVYYHQPCQSLFVQRQADQQIRITSGNVWYNENTHRYHSTPVQEVISQGKVRPVLVLDIYRFDKVSGLGQYVLALPLTSVKDRMKKGDGLDTLERNNAKTWHYLSPERNAQTGLNYPSVVVIATPLSLYPCLFKSLLGHLHPQDLAIIQQKFSSLVKL